MRLPSMSLRGRASRQSCRSPQSPFGLIPDLHFDRGGGLDELDQPVNNIEVLLVIGRPVDANSAPVCCREGMGFSVVIAVSGADPFHLSTDRRVPSGAGPDTHEAAHLRIGRRQSPASRILPSGRRRFSVAQGASKRPILAPKLPEASECRSSAAPPCGQHCVLVSPYTGNYCGCTQLESSLR